MARNIYHGTLVAGEAPTPSSFHVANAANLLLLLMLRNIATADTGCLCLSAYLTCAAGATNAEVIWQTDRPAARIIMLSMNLILTCRVAFSSASDVMRAPEHQAGGTGRVWRIGHTPMIARSKRLARIVTQATTPSTPSTATRFTRW